MRTGIKNSWKYEKDLMIIFNLKQVFHTISKKRDLLFRQVGRIKRKNIYKKVLQKKIQRIILDR